MPEEREATHPEPGQPAPGDPDFADIDPDMTWLTGREFKWPGDTLTEQQTQAAELLAEEPMPERVDAVLNLPRGTVRGWSKTEDFRREVIRHRTRLRVAVDEPNYEQALTPAQCRAAYMEALGWKQVEIARKLGRHRATINGWGRDPFYRRLVEQVAERVRAEHTEADQLRRDAERVEELRLAHEAIGNGLRDPDLKEAAKLGITVVRLHEQDRRR